MNEDLTFDVKLKREKKYHAKRFHKGQVVLAKKNSHGVVTIAENPAMMLGDNDYEIHIPEETFWRLLLQ